MAETWLFRQMERAKRGLSVRWQWMRNRAGRSLLRRFGAVRRWCRGVGLTDALLRGAIGGREGIVVAECATSERQGSVAVRAGKTGVDRQLLHARSEEPAEVSGIAVVSSSVSPRIYRAGFGHGLGVIDELSGVCVIHADLELCADWRRRR